jgi:hypothetical protein
MSQQGKKRILPLVMVALVTTFIAFRAYFQYRPVIIGVHESPSRHVNFFKERGWDKIGFGDNKSTSVVVPYQTASERYLTETDIRSLRSQMNWGNLIPPRYDSLEIKSLTSVLARRIEGNVWIEYDFVNSGGPWVMVNERRTLVRY